MKCPLCGIDYSEPIQVLGFNKAQWKQLHLKIHEDLILEDCFKIVDDIAFEEDCGRNPNWGVEAQRLRRKRSELINATFDKWEGEE